MAQQWPAGPAVGRVACGSAQVSRARVCVVLAASDHGMLGETGANRRDGGKKRSLPGDSTHWICWCWYERMPISSSHQSERINASLGG